MHLFAVTIDCADPDQLARFYQSLLGGSITTTTATFVALTPDTGLRLYFQPVERYSRPTWPHADIPTQVHLDFVVQDLDEAEARAIALGAGKPGQQPAPSRFRVLVDPEGHPFCLVAPAAARVD